jgi:hypothetical protein
VDYQIWNMDRAIFKPKHIWSWPLHCHHLLNPNFTRVFEKRYHSCHCER